jgi:hypothetical protein
VNQLTEQQVEDRREVAAALFAHVAGKAFFSFLLDDLGLYDVATTESEMVLHNFALVFLKRYFAALADDESYRSLLTEAIIGVPIPPKEL